MLKFISNDLSTAFDEARAGTMNFGIRISKAVPGLEELKSEHFAKYFRDNKRTVEQGLGSAADLFAGVPFVEFVTRLGRLAEGFGTTATLNLELASNSRLRIGGGEADLFGNALTLHPVFGVPYLPGSSLKGVCRRAYIDEYHGGLEHEALGDPTFCDLFGCTGITKIEEVDADGNVVRKQNGDPTTDEVDSYYRRDGDLGDRRGALLFFDGLPTAAPKVVVDIVNPHYKPYYEKALPPADIYNPEPANFLAVEGGEFAVVLALDPGRGAVAPIAGGEETGFERAVAALRLALTEDGMGGKTTVGYGRFRDVGAERAAEEAARRRVLEEARARERAEEERKRAAVAADVQDTSLADPASLNIHKKHLKAQVRAVIVASGGGKASLRLLVAGLDDVVHEVDSALEFPEGRVVSIKAKFDRRDAPTSAKPIQNSLTNL